MRRRAFVERLGVAVAGSALGIRPAEAALRLPAPARRLTRIGLELYAVRDAMRRDPERTLAAIRAIGYTEVELLWSFRNFDRSTEQVRAALEREGLRAPSAHIAPETITTDWERSLETAAVLGHEMLIVPSRRARPGPHSTRGTAGQITSIAPVRRLGEPVSGSHFTTSRTT
jgi:hypothetical protein